MSEIKTLGYDWEFGHEELMLEISSYQYGDRLYIGLNHLAELDPKGMERYRRLHGLSQQEPKKGKKRRGRER